MTTTLQKRTRRAKAEDLTGRVFGLLTVLKAHKRDAYNFKTWLCKCACGSEIITKQQNILQQNTRSCGCLRRTRTKKYIDLVHVVVNAAIESVKQNAITSELHGAVTEMLEFRKRKEVGE